MDQRIRDVLSRLEERSRSEVAVLAELNARGAPFVREAAGRLMLDVGVDVARLLHLLTITLKAQKVVEIGGSVGYSTLWFADAVRSTGGRVISFEFDEGKAREMRENLQTAGLLGYVDVICDDVSKRLPELEGPFDLVLIDHWKDVYIREFEVARQKLRPGGVIIADNILSPAATAQQMQTYVNHVRSIPNMTSFTLPLGQGIELTCSADTARQSLQNQASTSAEPSATA